MSRFISVELDKIPKALDTNCLGEPSSSVFRVCKLVETLIRDPELLVDLIVFGGS